MKENLRFICINLIIITSFIVIFKQTDYSQNRNRISGFVFGPNRLPVSDVYVELMNEVGSVLSRVKTNGSGQYSFTGLSPGRFTIKVQPFGTNLQEDTHEVEIVNNVAQGSFTSASIQEDFYLKLRKGETQAITSSGFLFFQDVPKEAEKAYKDAIILLAENRIELGITSLKSALSIFPNYFLALDRLGSEHIKLGQYTNAKEFYLKAVSVNDRSAESWYGISFSYYALKEPKLAVEAAKKAYSFAPESAKIALMLGISLRLDSKYQESEKTLLQAKKLAEGKIPDINWNLALLYAHNLKRYKDAANELELYLKAIPNHPNATGIQKLINQFRLNQPINNFT
jgi:tetratricopeptide (TPR) repeat protein